ncbi:hypothetical protein [Leisingera sp. ANG59]|uniref:hypothetical protein n=1 Tax=Leisingera sp. ANG59 TaxID=2675221 RepID=UPI0015742C54|nr:hypothetical protein [Leisingera sp. ANG59]NSY39545.1 hypothetical protein [Leisingera sp. ANG59]
MIRIFRTGAHAHRTPLSYPALAPLFNGQILEVNTPEQADLYVFAHILDIQNAPQAIAEDWRQRQRPIVLLSEEPFWDTLWGRQPLARHRLADSRWGRFPVHQLTHHSSAIFRFDRIPYYLLTNHRFANAYAAKFARNVRQTPAGWRRRFLKRRSDIAFLFERRDGAHHSIRWPEGDIAGLCHWRTQVAEACRRGRIERLGRSWQPGQPARSQLTDWHLDKLTLLDGRPRVIGAFENTHQPNYITEKLFDAFACGALPAYAAGPRHRVHDLGLPGASWLNLHGTSPARAAAVLDGLDWGDAAWLEATSEAYAAAQQQLAALLGTPGNWLQERQRLQAAVLTEFRSILDGASVWPDLSAA